MKLLRNLLMLLVFALPTGANAVSAGCENYSSDCDSLVACELYTSFADAQSGLTVNFNASTAKAILAAPSCTNYADRFKRDISTTIDNVNVTINWDKVREIIRNGGVSLDNGSSEMMSDSEIIELIIKVLGPDNTQQENFFKELAKSYVAAHKISDTTKLDDAFVLNFLADNDPQLTKYQKTLGELTGQIAEPDLGIDLDWDAILEEISEIMDQTMRKYGALVCENNRSYEGLIDAVGWIVTAVAAVTTFYGGGAGGAAVAAGRAALGAGMKASARALAKVGGKAAARKLSQQGGKQLAKSAIKLGLKTNMRGWNNYAGKGVLRAGVKNYVKIVGKNLKNKWTRLAAAGALIYQGGQAAGVAYSLVSSDADKEIVNCQDLDHNEGCYTVCGDSTTGWKGQLDMLNAQVLKPVMGKLYCVNEKDYHLYDNDTGAKLVMDANQLKQVKANMHKIQDKHPCDWNEDDIDMYIGYFIHNPDTLEISQDAMIIEDIIRIDD
ncbi:MAG: hypothetical protein K2I81_01780 [Alphaproteobacteria bacterium]|nr:hypothetical protein [Alphaproteobacteria bacterium]